ncbi:hypothetical protein A8M43_22870 [Escherichia coli]|nr:hypothetical protein A8M43_22870 [Escherichia coli]
MFQKKGFTQAGKERRSVNAVLLKRAALRLHLYVLTEYLWFLHSPYSSEAGRITLGVMNGMLYITVSQIILYQACIHPFFCQSKSTAMPELMWMKMIINTAQLAIFSYYVIHPLSAQAFSVFGNKKIITVLVSGVFFSF